MLRRRHTVLLQRWLQKLACSQASIQAYWRWRSVEFPLGKSPCLAMQKPNSQVPRCKRARSPRRASRAGGKRHLQRHSSGELPSRGSKKPRLPPARLARRRGCRIPSRVQDPQRSYYKSGGMEQGCMDAAIQRVWKSGRFQLSRGSVFSTVCPAIRAPLIFTDRPKLILQSGH